MKLKSVKKTEPKKLNIPKLPWTAIFLVIAAILLYLLFDPKTTLGGDNCHYMSLASSIFKGHYNIEAFIGTPPEVGVTPGYPLILAATLKIFGRTFVPAKIFSFLCFIGALWIFWKLLTKAGIDKKVSWLILAFAVFNTAISEFSHWELTEAPFMFISSIAIYFYFKTLEKSNLTNLLLTIIFGAAGFYIRTAGIGLPIAIGLGFLITKRWKEFAIYTGAVAILFLPWLIRYITIGRQVGGGIYVHQFTSDVATGAVFSISGFISKMFRNFSKYAFVNLPSLFLPSLTEKFYINHILGYVFGGIFLILIIWAMIKSIRSKLNLYSIYIVIYLLILISFSEQAALVRYLVVVFPFIALFLALGSDKLFNKIGFKNTRNYTFALIVIIVLLAIPNYWRTAQENTRMLSEYNKGDRFAGYNIAFTRFIEANEWLKNYDKTDVGVISRKPTLTWWFSAHPSKGYKLGTPEQVKADIDSLGAKYVIIDQIFGQTAQYLVPAVRAFPEHYKVIHVTKRPETYVLEVIRDSLANPLTQ